MCLLLRSVNINEHFLLTGVYFGFTVSSECSLFDVLSSLRSRGINIGGWKRKTNPKETPYNELRDSLYERLEKQQIHFSERVRNDQTDNFRVTLENTEKGNPILLKQERHTRYNKTPHIKEYSGVRRMIHLFYVRTYNLLSNPPITTPNQSQIPRPSSLHIQFV